jgi:hypothetical protein
VIQPAAAIFLLYKQQLATTHFFEEKQEGQSSAISLPIATPVDDCLRSLVVLFVYLFE